MNANDIKNFSDISKKCLRFTYLNRKIQINKVDKKNYVVSSEDVNLVVYKNGIHFNQKTSYEDIKEMFIKHCESTKTDEKGITNFINKIKQSWKN